VCVSIGFGAKRQRVSDDAGRCRAATIAPDAGTMSADRGKAARAATRPGRLPSRRRQIQLESPMFTSRLYDHKMAFLGDVPALCAVPISSVGDFERGKARCLRVVPRRHVSDRLGHTLPRLSQTSPVLERQVNSRDTRQNPRIAFRDTAALLGCQCTVHATLPPRDGENANCAPHHASQLRR